MVIRKILVLLINLFLVGTIGAQSSGSFKLRYKIKDGQVLLRVCPENGTVWDLGNQYGYTVEKYEGASNELLETFNLNLSPIENWEPLYNMNDYYYGVSQFIFFDQLPKEEQEEDIPSDEYTESEKKGIRFNFSSLGINQFFEMAKMAGLALEDPTIDFTKEYIYKVSLKTPTQNYTESIRIQADQYEDPLPPSPSTTSSNKKVDLRWYTVDYKPYFHSYKLEISKDSIQFYMDGDLPFMDYEDTISVDDRFNYIITTDSLSSNEEKRWYRLSGMDYFGDYSLPSEAVLGTGAEPIEIAPYFTDGIQTDTNYAVLKWEVEKKYTHLIDHFVISQADSLGATYKNITKLDNTARSFTTEMEFESNYYILTTVPFKGAIIHSYPIMVMSYDRYPPHQPIGLEAMIDTSGIVRLKWEENTDDDLLGYSVFRTNFRTSDYYKLTDLILEDTTFIDSLSLKLSVDSVYYRIAALDKRHIQSEFSVPVALKRPDKHPPVEPHIYHVDKLQDTIVLQWYNSASEDALIHQLFRKIVKEEEEWTLVESFNISDSISEYYDVDIKQGAMYAYILRAIDDDDLVSLPSQPVIIQAIDDGIQPPIQDFNVAIDESKNTADLTWNYNEPDVFEYWLYKKRVGGRLSLFKKLEPTILSFRDSNLRTNSRYEYYIKAVFRDGTNSPFSEKLIVELKSK